MDDAHIELPKNTRLFVGISIALTLFLTTAAIIAFLQAKNRPGTIVLPGGITYLGPSSQPQPTIAQPTTFTADATVSWTQHQGKIFPYSFSYPSTMSLGVFPNDPFDAVTIFCCNKKPEEAMFLRVEVLKFVHAAEYITTKQSNRWYVESWWKQYSWKGVGSITEFTNSKGLKGYRAKYLNNEGKTPFDNFFFEVPGRADLMIWMASDIIDPTIFERMVDSLTWVQR